MGYLDQNHLHSSRIAQNKNNQVHQMICPHLAHYHGSCHSVPLIRDLISLEYFLRHNNPKHKVGTH